MSEKKGSIAGFGNFGKKMLTVSAMTAVSQTATKVTGKGKVIVNLLNIRRNAGKDAEIIGRLKLNDIIEIIDTSGEWFCIKFKNAKAYVFGKYVEIVKEKQHHHGKVTVNSLNVRKEADLNAEIIGLLVKNDEVIILEKQNQWLLIDYQGTNAYISSAYIEITDPDEIDTNVADQGYFYQRADLKNIALEPAKKYVLPSKFGAERTAILVWNSFGNFIQTISNELGIEVSTALSVLCVESGGKGFADDGRMLIRFENHVFYLFWGEKNPDIFAKHFKFNTEKRRENHLYRTSADADWQVCHTNQETEWNTFNFAKTIDNENALYSISMGAPQIMGFNYKIIGYQSATQMFEFFKKDIRYHLCALFDFCKYKPERVEYLKNKDFLSFAKEYNGLTAPEQYEKRLQEFYGIFKNLLK